MHNVCTDIGQGAVKCQVRLAQGGCPSTLASLQTQVSKRHGTISDKCRIRFHLLGDQFAMSSIDMGPGAKSRNERQQFLYELSTCTHASRHPLG